VRSSVVAVLLVGACGRIAFDPVASTSDASPDGMRDGPILPSGAVLYLPFESPPVGSAVVDVVRGHAVSCRTTCPTLTTGRRGSAYAFNSAGPDVLEVPYLADLDPSAGFTIAVWIRMNVLPTTQYYCVLGKPVGAGTFNSHALCVENTGDAFYHSGTTAGTDNVTGSVVPILQWHHLAMTWDGTTKRGYLDGVPDGMRAVSVENDANPIVVGADLNSGAPAYPLDGALDEVLVFDRPLSVSEIQTLAQ